MPNLLSSLTNGEQARLLEELNYMNLEEIHAFCAGREHKGVIRLLRELTGGRFENGAVVRVLAMEFWTRGEAPTFQAFARSWTKAKAEQYRLLTPEYAYLTDLKRQQADGDWKALRNIRAKSALNTLARIAPAVHRRRLVPTRSYR